MNKIGTTTSGTVIVEMTAAQFDALVQAQTQKTSAAVAAQDGAAKMSLAQKAAFVRERLPKLKPKKKDGVVHSIAAMFQFSGGIAESETQDIIARLQKEKFLVIDKAGKVTYAQV